MKLSIFVPVYNEEGCVGKLLTKLVNLKLDCQKEIIVVDDGSTDNSWEMIKKHKGVKALKHSANKGRGAAIKTALKKCSGDVVVFQDADLEYNPKDLPRLIEPIIQKQTKVVYGSRFIYNSDMPKLFVFGNKFLTGFFNILYGSRITDLMTGYKAIDSKLLKELKVEAGGFEFEPELTFKLIRSGLKIKEMPITYSPRRIGMKKLKVMGGIKLALFLVWYRVFG